MGKTMNFWEIWGGVATIRKVCCKKAQHSLGRKVGARAHLEVLILENGLLITLFQVCEHCFAVRELTICNNY